MIPYELIIPSASRPHLFGPALDSLLGFLDTPPARILVHDDAAWPGKQEEIGSVVRAVAQAHGIAESAVVLMFDNPPISHGPSLAKLLDEVKTEYVLYSQDDLRMIRPLPIAMALRVMHEHGLHQIRFNKRSTMAVKGDELRGTWEKKQFGFAGAGDPACAHAEIETEVVTEEPTALGREVVARCKGCDGYRVTLTVADHWYFQTGLWRVSRIRPITQFWTQRFESFGEHCEIKINKTMNRQIPEFNYEVRSGALSYDLPESGHVAMDQDVRARVQRTFIWGPIGMPRFLDNLATDPKDWALWRPRGGSGGPRDSQSPEGQRP